jgi:hypothetical protein
LTGIFCDEGEQGVEDTGTAESEADTAKNEKNVGWGERGEKSR